MTSKTTEPMDVWAVRLPQETIDRAEALIPVASRLLGTNVKRADVLRLALARGLASLEATSKAPGVRKARRRRSPS